MLRLPLDNPRAVAEDAAYRARLLQQHGRFVETHAVRRMLQTYGMLVHPGDAFYPSYFVRDAPLTPSPWLQEVRRIGDIAASTPSGK